MMKFGLDLKLGNHSLVSVEMSFIKITGKRVWTRLVLWFLFDFHQIAHKVLSYIILVLFDGVLDVSQDSIALKIFFTKVKRVVFRKVIGFISIVLLTGSNVLKLRFEMKREVFSFWSFAWIWFIESDLILKFNNVMQSFRGMTGLQSLSIAENLILFVFFVFIL